MNSTPGWPNRKETEAVCEKLLVGGWIAEFCIHDPAVRYGLKWTPKGREQATRLNQITRELGLDSKEFFELLRICSWTAPDKGQNL